MSRMSRLIPIIGGAVAGGVIALVIASGGTSHSSTTTTVFKSAPSTSIPSSFTAGKGLTINQIYRAARARASSTSRSPPPASRRAASARSAEASRQQGEGAGVVYDTKGDILTDEHVVAGATKVTVAFQDGYKASRQGARHRSLDRRRRDPGRRAGERAAPDPVRGLATARRSVTRWWRSAARSASPRRRRTGIVSAVGRSIQAPEQLHDPRRDPDRRGDQPRQLGRTAARRQRPRARPQRPDPDQLRLERRRRLRDPVEHGRADRQRDHHRPPGQARLRRRRAQRRTRPAAPRSAPIQPNSPASGRRPAAAAT